MAEGEKRRWSYGQKIATFAAVAVFGVGFLVLGSFFDGWRGEVSANTEERSPEEYALAVEARVESICREATGHSAKAVVSLAGGYRAVYAEDSHTGSGE